MRTLAWSLGVGCILSLIVGCGAAPVTKKKTVGGCTATSCPIGQTCQSGTCMEDDVPACRRGWTDCSGECVELDEDIMHCGACGNVCGKSHFLKKGVVVGDSSKNLIAPKDSITNIAIDKSKNIYVTGFFEEKVTFGNTTLKTSSLALFVAKMSPTGRWMWAISAGDAKSSGTKSHLVVDNDGYLYFTKSFVNKGGIGSCILSTVGRRDVFVAKVDRNGKCLWATQAGGKATEVEGDGLALDQAGNIYVTGALEGTVSFGDTALTSAGKKDVFVAKLDKSGKWVWGKTAGSVEDDEGVALQISTEGTVYVTGTFSDDITFGDTTLPYVGQKCDLFVATLDADGKWGWAIKAGGNSYDLVQDMVLDASGHAYIVGYYAEGEMNFGDVTLKGDSSNSYDVFVAKVSKEGKWLWAFQAGGPRLDRGQGITIDSDGYIYVTGSFFKDARFGETQFKQNGLFVSKLDADGKLLWTGSAFGTALGNDLAMNKDGELYVVGTFSKRLTMGHLELRGRVGFDGFIATVAEGAPVCSEGVCL